MDTMREALVQARARVVEALRDAGDTATYHTEDLRQVISRCDAALGDKQPRKPDPPTATATVAMPEPHDSSGLREALEALAAKWEEWEKNPVMPETIAAWYGDFKRELREVLAAHPTDAAQRRADFVAGCDWCWEGDGGYHRDEAEAEAHRRFGEEK